MKFFTEVEFKAEYPEYVSLTIPNNKIKAACQMIFSQIGLRYRNSNWDNNTVPISVKDASMAQLSFMFDHDLPFLDSNDIQAGSMSAKLNSDYSTLALRILANAGLLYRGNPVNQNMGLEMPFGDC